MCVDIGILQDMALEGDHSFRFNVISATPSVIVVGMPCDGTVTIFDDDSMCAGTSRHISCTLATIDNNSE